MNEENQNIEQQTNNDEQTAISKTPYGIRLRQNDEKRVLKIAKDRGQPICSLLRHIIEVFFKQNPNYN